jgi:hypothetical protein
VRTHDALREVQPDPEPLVRPGVAAVGLRKGLEDLLSLALRDAGSAVGDVHLELAPHLAELDLNALGVG